MYIVREIFYLHFGHYKDAKVLIEKAIKEHILPQPDGSRILTDFTGTGYRLIAEMPYNTLGDYEAELKRDFDANKWQDWYTEFKPLIHHSEREILKQIAIG